MQDKIIRAGFIIAGLANIIGILIITQGMTTDTLVKADPAVFSTFGLLMIMLWGLAYISTARFATVSVLLPLVFALEKLAYTLNWATWLGEHSAQLASIREQDFLGGFFLGGYGINDGLFCLFFVIVAVINWRRGRALITIR